jgi:type I restriction enzyme S subunit
MKYQTYPAYKDSGVEWLGDVPEHWDVIQIKHLSAVQRGASPRPIDDPKYFDDEGEYAWVRIADVSSSDGVLRETTQRLSNLGNSLSVKIHSGELFISIAGTVGKPCISEIKACIHDGFVYFPTLKIPPIFLYRIFEAGLCYGGLGKLGTQLNLNTETIGAIRVALPNSKELEHVLNFLDHETAKIDTLIEKQQRLIELLKEKRQAVISHAVTKGLNPNAPMKESGVAWLGDVPEGWEVWKFSHFAPIITCGIASTPTYVDENEGMPFLSAQNIQGNKLSLHKYNYISHELHRQLTQHRKPERGDLLVTRVGAGIGAACVIETDLEFSIYVSLTHIRVLPHIANNRFIAYFFSTDYCQYLNHQGTVTGGGVGNLNVQNVVKYQIPLPSIEEQIKIADYIDSKNLKFAALIESVESAIELMQERRTALISAAVTGKIDVRHWGD